MSRDWGQVFAHEACVAKVEEFFRTQGVRVQHFGQETFFTEEFHRDLLDLQDDFTAAFIKIPEDTGRT